MTTQSPSQLVSTFFTLTSKEAVEYRRGIFKQIHEIVFHGKGGYAWPDVYDMPTWLRNWTFNEINNYYKEQNKASKSPSDQQTLVGPDGKVNRQAFKQAQKNYTKTSYK